MTVGEDSVQHRTKQTNKQTKAKRNKTKQKQKQNKNKNKTKQKKTNKKILLSSSHYAFCRLNYYNLMASLSHLEALLLDLTSDAPSNCSF